METEEAQLERLRSFVEGNIPGSGSLSASICCEDEFLDLRVRCFAEQKDILTLTFRVRDAVLRVFQMLVLCPTLTQFDLRFRLDAVQSPSASDSLSCSDITLVLEALSDMRKSRSLSRLEISVSDYGTSGSYLSPLGYGKKGGILSTRHLSTLVSNNPFLGNSALDLEEIDHSGLKHGMKTSSYCFCPNSALKTCTLETWCSSAGGDIHYQGQYCNLIMKTILDLVKATGIKELVLGTRTPSDVRYGYCLACHTSISGLVRQNPTSLEKLEVGIAYLPHNRHKDILEVMALSLGCNNSLKEFGYRCTVAEFKLLVRVFTPNSSGDHQRNNSLSTLKVYLARGMILDCMTGLRKLLGSNTTLKHVELHQGLPRRYTPPILFRNLKRERVVQSRIRGKLERMLIKELRRNTCLLSLIFGWWRLVRVGEPAGHEWEMRYVGPCLAEERFQWTSVTVLMKRMPPACPSTSAKKSN